MAREVRLWEFMREGLRGVKGLHMRRVENLVGSGAPDVDGCYNGRYFELELKGHDRPAGSATPIDLEIRPSQVIYHRHRVRAGGNIWLYVRIGRGRDVLKYLIPGSYTGRLASKPYMTEEELRQLAVLDPQHTAQQLLDHMCSVSGA